MKVPGGGLILFSLAVLFGGYVLFGHTACDFGDSRQAMAKNDVTQLASAVTAYEGEYGHLPGTGRSVVGTELMDALMGGNSLNLNPRQIVFFEAKRAKNGRGGVTPEGIFVDPWGAPYQIAFASGSDNIVTNAGPDGVEVHKRVAIWSNPAAGKFPWFSDKAALQRRRAVTSWD